MLKPTLFAGLSLLLFASACRDASQPPVYRSAITGEACVPDWTAPDHGQMPEPSQGGHNSPTGIPGDNVDDKPDCPYDGDSGGGNDVVAPDGSCLCDPQGCCPADDGDDGDSGGSDDGDSGNDDGSGGDDDNGSSGDDDPNGGCDGSGDGDGDGDGDGGGDGSTTPA